VALNSSAGRIFAGSEVPAGLDEFDCSETPAGLEVLDGSEEHAVHANNKQKARRYAPNRVFLMFSRLSQSGTFCPVLWRK
jgi:hypothetical protein